MVADVPGTSLAATENGDPGHGTEGGLPRGPQAHHGYYVVVRLQMYLEGIRAISTTCGSRPEQIPYGVLELCRLPAGNFFRMVKLNPQHPIASHGSLWKDIPDGTQEDLKIQAADFTKVTSRDLLPKWQKNLPGPAFDIRLVDQAKPLPLIPTNYATAIKLPWITLQQRGLYMPIMPISTHGARMLSKWEVLRCYGFHGDTILPSFEEDAFLLLSDADIGVYPGTQSRGPHG